MMPPVLGLKTALPTRLHYRVGACAAAMFATTLALPAVSDVAPAGAEEVLASDSTVVVLVVGGPDDSVAVLRQMAQDQAALTPPTAAAEDGETTAYTLGRVA